MISYFYTKINSGVGMTAVSAMLARVVTAVLQILTVRAAIFLIGIDQYSIIAIIVGLQAWFMILDFGGSFSFLNYASEKQAVGKGAQECLACGLIWSIASVLVGTLVLNILAAPAANWLFQNGKIFTKFKDAETALRVGGTLFIIFANTQLISRLWLAEGRGYIANILPVLGSLSTFLIFKLVGLLGAFHLDTSITVLIFCFPNALVQLACLIWVSLKRGVVLSSCDKEFFRVFGKRALQATVFSLQAAFTLQIDYIILSRLANSNEIVIYSILSRIFILLSFVYTSVLTSIWPILSYSIVHRHVAKLRQMIKYLFIFGTAFVVLASAVIYILQDHLFDLMTHGKIIVIPPFLVIFMGLNQLAVLWVSILSQIMQVAGRLNIMIRASFFQLAISVGLQYWLTIKFGITGIVAGVLLSYMIGGLVPLIFFVRLFLRKLEGEELIRATG
ncbi:MAG: MATE family efflux transporter [Sphingomonas phyllosphaerae]|uniref:MATE family efflux transporter n=1 Tax=Sphingomonas phyllosphaerae TaxID=257003 RepID=UPI002FFBDA84